VKGPGFLSRQPEPAHDPRHGLRAHGLPEPLLDEAAQVRQRPARWFALLRVRPDQNPVDEHGLLALAQDLRPVAVRAVEEAGETLGVEPDHRVAQRLALNPDRSRRIRPAHPFKRMGDRQHPLRRAPARLLLGQAPQLPRRRDILPDRQCASHAPPPNGPARNHGRDVRGTHASHINSAAVLRELNGYSGMNA
jgi:hypothetical protein